ncbi:MAG: hypothetical protein B6245_17630, partial [Desulfobacteraceae bacterium 4572_88]
KGGPGGILGDASGKIPLCPPLKKRGRSECVSVSPPFFGKREARYNSWEREYFRIFRSKGGPGGILGDASGKIPLCPPLKKRGRSECVSVSPSNYQLVDHYNMMEEQNIVVSFKGEISNKTLVSLAEMLKKMFSLDRDTKRKFTKRLFSIFIELAQNICLYSAQKIIMDGKEVGSGIIVVEKRETFYRIKSGNLVPNSVIEGLSAKVTHINQLDKPELRKFYKERLKAPRKPDQKGGGVGLIVIARNSGSPIDVNLNPIDENHTFIEISTQISEEI